MTRTLSAVVMCAAVLLAAPACDKPAPPLPPPPAAPPAPPPAKLAAPQVDAGPARPKMVANTDGLSLAERIAKREAEQKKVADQLAKEEHERLIKYDRSKLPLHLQTFTFITKTRERYDALEKKLAGSPDKMKAKVEIEKTAGSLRPSIVAAGKKMATIDPKGGNSNVTTDYDVMLNSLANDYPNAVAEAIDGQPSPLQDERAELDKRTKKITEWLAELKKK
jgi:hypothetical protein